MKAPANRELFTSETRLRFSLFNSAACPCWCSKNGVGYIDKWVMEGEREENDEGWRDRAREERREGGRG